MDTLIKPSARGTLVALCAASFLGLSACAYQPVGPSETSDPIKTGVAYFELECEDPELLTVEVDYEIIGAAIPRIRGVMTPIPGTTKVSATVSLPTGADYTVLLSALVDEGKTDCRTSGVFDILEEQSTTLALTLQCDELGAGIGQDAGTTEPPDAGEQIGAADLGPDAAIDASFANPTGSAVVLLDPQIITKDSGVPARDAAARDAAAQDAAAQDAAAHDAAAHDAAAHDAAAQDVAAQDVAAQDAAAQDVAAQDVAAQDAAAQDAAAQDATTQDATAPDATARDAAAQDAAAPDPLTETCAACSQRICGESQGSPHWSDCYLSTDRVDVGAAAGTSKSQACAKVLSCILGNGCSLASAGEAGRLLACEASNCAKACSAK